MVARSSPACIELSCGELHASVQARKDQINQDASASSQLTLPPRLLLEALLLVDFAARPAAPVVCSSRLLRACDTRKTWQQVCAGETSNAHVMQQQLCVKQAATTGRT